MFKKLFIFLSIFSISQASDEQLRIIEVDDVSSVTRMIPDLATVSPSETCVIFDLDGTLTQQGYPKIDYATPRGMSVEFVNWLFERNFNFVISSAWIDHHKDIVDGKISKTDGFVQGMQRVKALGLEKFIWAPPMRLSNLPEDKSYIYARSGHMVSVADCQSTRGYGRKELAPILLYTLDEGTQNIKYLFFADDNPIHLNSFRERLSDSEYRNRFYPNLKAIYIYGMNEEYFFAPNDELPETKHLLNSKLHADVNEITINIGKNNFISQKTKKIHKERKSCPIVTTSTIYTLSINEILYRTSERGLNGLTYIYDFSPLAGKGLDILDCEIIAKDIYYGHAHGVINKNLASKNSLKVYEMVYYANRTAYQQWAHERRPLLFRGNFESIRRFINLFPEIENPLYYEED